MTLNLSPWARKALTADEEAGITARVSSLGCLLSVQTYREGGWTIHASSRSVHADRYGAKGSLAVAVHAVLDDFRDKKAAVDEDVARYTPEEILTIAHQSDLLR